MTEMIILIAVIILIRMRMPMIYEAGIIIQLLTELRGRGMITNKREVNLPKIIAHMLLKWKRVVDDKEPWLIRKKRYPENEKDCLEVMGRR